MGTVSRDGSVINSNEGVGVIKAGWHCGSPPDESCCAYNCPVCQKTNDSCDGCFADDTQKPVNECEFCNNGEVNTIKITDVKAAMNYNLSSYYNSEFESFMLCPAGEDVATVGFDGSVTGDNCTYTHEWDFGNGSISYSLNPVNTYNSPGVYTVKFNVGCKECSVTETADISVSVKHYDLDAVEAFYQILATVAGGNWTTPGQMLNHFIEGTGTEVSLSSDWLLETDVMADANTRIISNFEDTLNIIASELPPGTSIPFVDYQLTPIISEPTVDPFLFYSSGRSALTSTGDFVITKSEQSKISIVGTIYYNWNDLYDWQKFLTAPVPGFGDVSDEPARCLSSSGRAKDFAMKSEWTQNVNYSF